MIQLLESQLNENELKGFVISETESFRLSEVQYYSGNEKITMFRLDIKVNGIYETIYRYRKFAYHKVLSHDLNILKSHILHIDRNRGWFSIFGTPLNDNDWDGNNYAKGNPYKEIELARKYTPENITITDLGNGVYRFAGRYKNYGGVFVYLLWDKTLIGIITEIFSRYKYKNKHGCSCQCNSCYNDNCQYCKNSHRSKAPTV